MDHSSQKSKGAIASKGSWAPLIVMGLVCVGLLIAMLSRDANQSLVNSKPHPAVGKPAPQIDLIELSDTTKIVRPQIELADRVTLLHFWGTWCPPCRAEYPHLAELTNELQHLERFQFVPISCEGGRGETFEGLWQKTSSFFAKESINSPAFADPNGVTRTSLADRFDQPSLYFPTSVVVGPDGNIAGVWEGYEPNGIEEIAALVRHFIPETDPNCPLED